MTVTLVFCVIFNRRVVTLQNMNICLCSCCTLAVCVEYPQNFTLHHTFCVSTPLPSKLRDLSEHTAQIHQQNKEKVKWKALNVITSFTINGINYYSVVFNHFIKWNIFHVHVPLALFPNIGVADVEPDAELMQILSGYPKKVRNYLDFSCFIHSTVHSHFLSLLFSIIDILMLFPKRSLHCQCCNSGGNILSYSHFSGLRVKKCLKRLESAD